MKNTLDGIGKFLARARLVWRGWWQSWPSAFFWFLRNQKPEFTQTSPLISETPGRPPPWRTYVWIPGHWRWYRNRYDWVPGHYQRPPLGANRWIHGHWIQGRRGWLWIEGHWSDWETTKRVAALTL